MKAMERRLDALETRAGNMDYAHLTDEQLQARLIECVRSMSGAGVILPNNWEAACSADPFGFTASLKLQAEALLCET